MSFSIKKIDSNLVVAEISQSQNLHLQYNEPGKPTAQFAYNTQEERESAERILRNCGIEIGEQN